MKRVEMNLMNSFRSRGPVLLAFALLLSLGLSGCGKKSDSGSATSNAASREYVYRATELGLKNDENQSVNQVFRAGDDIYAYGTDWTEEGGSILTFYKIGEDGSVEKASEIHSEPESNFVRVTMNEDASVYCVKNIYHVSDNGEESDVAVDDSAGDAAASGDAQEDSDEETGDESGEEGSGGIEPRTADSSDNDGDAHDSAAADDTEDSSEDSQAEEAAQDEMAAATVDVQDGEDPIADDTLGEEEYVDDYYLVKMNLAGEELFSVKLNDVPPLKAMAQENGYFYVGDMYLDSGKALYFYIYNEFYQFDLDGNFVKKVTGPGGENPFEEVSDLIRLADGRMVALMYEENGMSLAEADLDAGTLGERYKLPGRSYDYSCYPGVDYDLYLASTYGLHGYNLGDEDKTPIMSSMDSDFSFYGIYQVVGLNEREFIAITNDWESGDTLTKFTKVDPKDVKEKQVITLAMSSTDWDVRRLAIQFNKNSENYRISVLDYDAMYATEEDWSAGLTRLNADIVSGKVPDIMLLNTSMPVDSYISKGLFADLKPFIEKDEALNIDDFMPNVLEAFSVDGKLYSLVPSYSIDTVVAKTSEVGKERGWTVQEAQELLASKPEGTQFMVNITRDAMLQYCFSMAGSQFIDWESGTCNFDSDGFVQMLEFIATFPEEVNWEAMPDDFWDSYDSMWREGRAIASVTNIGDLQSFNRLEKGTFGEEITMIGFPSSDGDGSVIWPNLQFALSAKSKSQEGAWEFLRTFLLDEYQEKVEYGFPLSIKQLDKNVEKAMERPFYMDENNNKVEYDDTTFVNGVEVVIPPITRERADEVLSELYSFTQAYRSDDMLLNIVQEEAAPFFAGQKSAREVVSIIQSRVQIYVNENR